MELHRVVVSWVLARNFMFCAYCTASCTVYLFIPRTASRYDKLGIIHMVTISRRFSSFVYPLTNNCSNCLYHGYYFFFSPHWHSVPTNHFLFPPFPFFFSRFFRFFRLFLYFFFPTIFCRMYFPPCFRFSTELPKERADWLFTLAEYHKMLNNDAEQGRCLIEIYQGFKRLVVVCACVCVCAFFLVVCVFIFFFKAIVNLWG